MIAFKYRACQEKEGKCRDIDILLGDQVYASPLSQLNDCFEGRYSDNIDVQLNEIAESSHYDMTAIKTQWQELKRTVEAAGIYSLSLSEDGFPNNKVLWSLYAGEYSGFCVEYDTEKLVQNERFPWLVYGLTVRYQKDAPTIDVKDFSSESQLIQKMIGTKGLDWEREKEYRLVYDKPGVKTYNRSALKAVYLGFRMSDNHKQRIVNGLQGRDVNIYEMVSVSGSYDFNADLKFSLHRKIENVLRESEYEIIGTNHHPKVENFYVFYKNSDRSDEKLKAFVKAFREMYANVDLYDSTLVGPLLTKYPLNDEEVKVMREHSIGLSTFDAPDFIMRGVYD